MLICSTVNESAVKLISPAENNISSVVWTTNNTPAIAISATENTVLSGPLGPTKKAV